MKSLFVLSGYDMGLVAALICFCAACSLYISLGIHKALGVAVLRMIIQLTLVGYILRFVFQSSSPWMVIGYIMIMMAAATYEIANRQDKTIARWWLYGMGGSALVSSTLVVVAIGLASAVRPSPWYAPREVIPLMGIILGNAMNGASVALKALFNAGLQQRRAIEAQLAIGIPYYMAMKPHIRSSVQLALIPTMNTMAAAGIVTMPGIMTGQLLAGMDPVGAVRYQIILLSLLITANLMCSLLCVYGAAYRLTDRRERLRLENVFTQK